MRLTDREARVVRYLEMKGDAEQTEIARQLKLQTHSVHYTVARLIEAGVLRRRVSINTYRIGLIRVAAFISLQGMGESAYAAFIGELVKSPYVALVLELSGSFMLEVNLVGDNVAALRTHLDWLVQRAKSAWISKSVAVQVEHVIYGTKLLGSGPATAKPFGYHADVTQVSIDSLDRAILRTLMEPEWLSLRKIAKQLDEAPSTVEYRIKRLESSGVITGYTFLLEHLELLHYVVLVHMKILGPLQRRKLGNFSRSHPSVFYTVENIGSWDFEVGLVVRNPKDLNRALQALHEALEGEISHTEVPSLIERRKVCDYPLHREPISRLHQINDLIAALRGRELENTHNRPLSQHFAVSVGEPERESPRISSHFGRAPRRGCWDSSDCRLATNMKALLLNSAEILSSVL